jgi:hypothetical protein
MSNNLPTIPIEQVGEVFIWRQWFTKVYSILAGGVSGTFKSADTTPKTITVTNGIITKIV